MSLDTGRLRATTRMADTTDVERILAEEAIDKYFGAGLDDRVVRGKETFAKRWVHTKNAPSQPWQGTPGGLQSFVGEAALPRARLPRWMTDPAPEHKWGGVEEWSPRKQRAASAELEAKALARVESRAQEVESSSSDVMFDGFCGSVVRRSALSAGSAPSCRTRAPQNVPLSGTVMAQYQSGDYDRFANEDIAPAAYPDQEKYGLCGCSSDDHLSRLRPAGGFAPAGATAALSLYRSGGCGAR